MLPLDCLIVILLLDEFTIKRDVSIFNKLVKDMARESSDSNARVLLVYQC